MKGLVTIYGRRWPNGGIEFILVHNELLVTITVSYSDIHWRDTKFRDKLKALRVAKGVLIRKVKTHACSADQ